MEIILFVYLLLSYAMGAGFAIMGFIKDEVFTVGDLLMFLLAPFTMVPILFVQILSNFVDLDDIIARK